MEQTGQSRGDATGKAEADQGLIDAHFQPNIADEDVDVRGGQLDQGEALLHTQASLDKGDVIEITYDGTASPQKERFVVKAMEHTKAIISSKLGLGPPRRTWRIVKEEE